MLRLALLAATLMAADSAFLGEGGREGGSEAMELARSPLLAYSLCCMCYHVYEAVWEWYIGEGCFSRHDSQNF